MDDLKHRLDTIAGRREPSPDLMDRTMARFTERRRRRRVGGLATGIGAMVAVIVVAAVVASNRSTTESFVAPPSGPSSSSPVTTSPLRTYHDPSGWSVGIPPGWAQVGFGFATPGWSVLGVQISNVTLPEPRPVEGVPVQADGQDLPVDAIAIVIAKQVDPSVDQTNVVDLPLDYPDGWFQGSAPAGQPTLDGIWFRGGATTYVATVKFGADAYSDAGIAMVREVVRSIRYTPRRFSDLPTANPTDTETSIGETDLEPGFLPVQVVDASRSRLTVESRPGFAEWTLDSSTCDVSGRFLQDGSGGDFGGAGCEGDAVLSWGGAGGSLGANGEIFTVPSGRIVPDPGVTVRITLRNGDVQSIPQQNGLWMAVIGRCHDYVGTEVRRVEAIDANGATIASIPVKPEQPDPLNPWPPC